MGVGSHGFTGVETSEPASNQEAIFFTIDRMCLNLYDRILS